MFLPQCAWFLVIFKFWFSISFACFSGDNAASFFGYPPRPNLRVRRVSRDWGRGPQSCSIWQETFVQSFTVAQFPKWEISGSNISIQSATKSWPSSWSSSCRTPSGKSWKRQRRTLWNLDLHVRDNRPDVLNHLRHHISQPQTGAKIFNLSKKSHFANIKFYRITG